MPLSDPNNTGSLFYWKAIGYHFLSTLTGDKYKLLNSNLCNFIKPSTTTLSKTRISLSAPKS